MHASRCVDRIVTDACYTLQELKKHVDDVKREAELHRQERERRLFRKVLP